MTGLRERTVFADRRLTVSAMESLELRTGKTNHGRFMTGRLQPIAVIVKAPDRTYALDMEARLVDIDRFNLSAEFDLE